MAVKTLKKPVKKLSKKPVKKARKKSVKSPVATPFEKIKQINLDCNQGRMDVWGLRNEQKLKLFGQTKCQLVPYLQNLSTSKMVHGRYPVFYFENSALISIDREIYVHNYFDGYDLTDSIRELVANYGDNWPSAVLNTSCIKRAKDAKSEKYRAILLINGDSYDSSADIGPEWNLVDEFDGYGFPVISFACLGQFFEDDQRRAIDLLTGGGIEIVDFTCDEYVKLTELEKEQLGKNQELQPPALGFTRVRHKWHRPGFVLLRYVKGNQFFLMGQDEGTYFGCELDEKPTNIADAIFCLIPREARNRKHLRQGEWFCVQKERAEVPEPKDCMIVLSKLRLESESCHLGVEHKESKRHYIQAGEIRITKDGVIFALDAVLTHQDHATLNGWRGWSAFYKNTAVRSFSQEGVD